MEFDGAIEQLLRLDRLLNVRQNAGLTGALVFHGEDLGCGSVTLTQRFGGALNLNGAQIRGPPPRGRSCASANRHSLFSFRCRIQRGVMERIRARSGR